MVQRSVLTPQETRRLFGRVALEIYVVTSKAEEVAQTYKEKTGEDPRGSQHFQLYDQKWGRQHRVYFDETDSDMERIEALYDVRDNDFPYLRQYSHRINDPNLFWALVDAGCRLGHNNP